MATQQATIDELHSLLGLNGPVSSRKMFGEYCIYWNEKPVALVCDDVLFVKPTPAGRDLLPGCEEGSPYPKAKPHLRIPPERWSADLAELLQVTAAALPTPRPRRKKA